MGLRLDLRGKTLIAGVDEVGRASLAGPVVAAAVVFRKGYHHPRIKDSKIVPKRLREELAPYIQKRSVMWSVAAVGPRRIEELNICQASRLAMRLALKRIEADLVLVDGNLPVETDLPQLTIVGGDALRVEISAASIVAKVYRDHLMQQIHQRFPMYHFDKNVGYGTPEHLEALRLYGPCRHHRRTFGYVKLLVAENPESIANRLNLSMAGRVC